MNSLLEYSGRPAHFDIGAQQVVVELPNEDVPLAPVGGQIVTICAWHSGSYQLTNTLKRIGYEVSHGVCETCSARVTAEIKEEQQ